MKIGLFDPAGDDGGVLAGVIITIVMLVVLVEEPGRDVG